MRKPARKKNRGRKSRKTRKKPARRRMSCPAVKNIRRDTLGAWIQREGKLGGPGYSQRSERERHRLLRCSLERFGYKSTLASLAVLRRNRSVSKKVLGVIAKDIDWLGEHKGVWSPKWTARSTIRSRTFQLQKGLTRKEALKKALKRSRKDHRGFTYDPKTGKAVLT